MKHVMKRFRPKGTGWPQGTYVRTSVFAVRTKTGPSVAVTRIRGPHRSLVDKDDDGIMPKTFYIETSLFEESFELISGQ